jgi:hypothetical protein
VEGLRSGAAEILLCVRLVLKVRVHSAKVMDYEGIKTLLWRANEQVPRLRNLWLDAGYRGEGKGADWVEETLGSGAWIWWSARKSPRGGADSVGQGVG